METTKKKFNWLKLVIEIVKVAISFFAGAEIGAAL
jgi:hypothetical protein